MNITINRLVEYINATQWEKYYYEENKNDIVTWMTFITTENDLKLLTGGEIVAIQVDIYDINKLIVLLNQCISYHASGILIHHRSKLPLKSKDQLNTFLETNHLFSMIIPDDVNLLNIEKKFNEYVLRMKNADIVEESFIEEFLFKDKRNEMLLGVEHVESFGLNPLGHYQIAVVRAKVNRNDKDRINKEQYVYQLLVGRLKNEKWHTYCMHFGRMIIILFKADEDDFRGYKNYQTLCVQCDFIKKQFPDIILRATLGRICSPITNIKSSFEEALFSLNMFKILSTADQAVVNYYDIGFYQLLRVLHNTEDFLKYYNERLSFLEEYDKEYKAELTMTLWAFLENDCNLNKTAAALFIHINTLRYRISKMEELTKSNLKSNSNLTEFYICYYIKRYLGMNDSNGFPS